MSSSEEQQIIKDHFLYDTPVNVAIEALQRQVDQLKRIVNNKSSQLCQTNNDDNADENVKILLEENKKLRAANDKAEYRIKMLLRALEARDSINSNKQTK